MLTVVASVSKHSLESGKSAMHFLIAFHVESVRLLLLLARGPKKNCVTPTEAKSNQSATFSSSLSTLKTAQDRRILISIKPEQEVVCNLLNSGIADNLERFQSPEITHSLLCCVLGVPSCLWNS